MPSEEYMNVYGRPVRADGTELRVCTTCEIDHIENCHTCFGFGVMRKLHGGGIAITAGEAHDNKFPSWVKCPECGSTPKGLPSDQD
jgi:hypothetical protein